MSSDGNDSPSPSDFLREPQQARSRKTLARILDAGTRLLLDQGPDAVTVTRVAKRARTSVGSFYARFPGKEELIRYLGERALDDAVQTWREIASDADASIEAELMVLMVQQLDGPGRILALLDGIEDPAPSRLRRYEDEVAGHFERMYGRTRAPGRGTVVGRVLVAALAAAARRGADHGLPTRGVLERELTILTSLYLGSTPTSAPVGRGEPEGVPEESVNAPEDVHTPPDPDTPPDAGTGEDPPAESDTPTSEPEDLGPDPDPFDVWG